MFIQTLRTYSRSFLLIVALVESLLLFHSLHSTRQQVIPHKALPYSHTTSSVSPELPVRLIIPAINVTADIQSVGVTPKGEMDIPNNIVDVGWFNLGPPPGKRGNSVIAGHLNGDHGQAGVFTDLNKLKKGDKMYVEDNKGVIIPFVVRKSRIYNPGYAEEIFSQSDSVHLNLITCDGVWNGAKKSYSKRLVVFADIAH